MTFSLEARTTPSRLMTWVSPLLAITLMLITGFIFFALLGKDPITAFSVFFIQPLSHMYGVGEMLLIASPLCIIALGLAIGYRANVWNIGAEGQMIIGGIAATAIALKFSSLPSAILLPMIAISGALGGLFWASIVAACRRYFNANEILTSLMLTYVAYQVLLYVLTGTRSNPAWLQDPEGGGFPLSPLLDTPALLPMLSEVGITVFEGSRANLGLVIILIALPLVSLFLNKSYLGYQMLVAGQAPKAAEYAGFKTRKLIWLCLLISGACAGLAGALEISGPVGQLQASWRPGYGFSAIIVAFVGRLQPVGIAFASLILAITYLGGEAAQYELNLPNSVSLLFQGVLLFYLLACDLFLHYRLRWHSMKHNKQSISEVNQ